jgi:hypothetical protein
MRFLIIFGGVLLFLHAVCNVPTVNASDNYRRSLTYNCYLGASTGPPSKVALVLSSFTTHVSSPNSLFYMFTTRAAEHESFFAHLDGRVRFLSIDFHERSWPPINMWRFKFFLDFLLQSDAHTCTNVMYSDTYDVFFQGDPFISPQYAAVLTFTTESKVIGEEIWNAQWIYNCYGLDELVLLHNKTIANSGVVYGPLASVVAYTGHLLDQFDDRSFHKNHHKGTDGTGLFRYGGFIYHDSTHSCWTDQGFLNHLLHVSYPHSDMMFAAPTNFENTVFTVGHNRPDLDFALQDGTLVRLNTDGSSNVPTMVHQLNRFPAYWARVLELYALKP